MTKKASSGSEEHQSVSFVFKLLGKQKVLGFGVSFVFFFFLLWHSVIFVHKWYLFKVDFWASFQSELSEVLLLGADYYLGISVLMQILLNMLIVCLGWGFTTHLS